MYHKILNGVLSLTLEMLGNSEKDEEMVNQKELMNEEFMKGFKSLYKGILKIT